MDQPEGTRYPFETLVPRMKVQGSDELPQLDSLTTHCSADPDRAFALDSLDMPGAKSSQSGQIQKRIGF